MSYPFSKPLRKYSLCLLIPLIYAPAWWQPTDGRSPSRRCGPVWGKRVGSKKLLAYERQTSSLVGAEGAEVVTKKACTPVSATRPVWSHYGRTMSKPSPSTPTHAGSTFSIKRGCGWMPAAATPVPEAGSAWGRPCRSLATTLRSGDVLVLDNLAVRKIGGLREWLAKRGVQVLFLPPYSPDFSPTTSSWFMTQRFGA